MPSIDVDLNARAAERNLRTLAAAFDDVADAASDAVRDASRGGDRMESTFRDVAADAGRAERAVSDVGTGARGAGDDVKRGMDRAKEGLGEFKDEANSTTKEAAASFDGTAEGIADTFQELAANAFAGFGPAGAAAGIAVAAILGTILNNAQATQEKLAEARQAAADLATEMYESGGEPLPLTERVDDLFRILSGEAGPQNSILGLIDQWTDFGSTLDAVKRTARLTGTDLSSMVRALSGNDLDAADQMLAAINEKIADLESNVGTAWAWDENLRGARAIRTEIEKNVEAQRLAAELNDTEFAKEARYAEARKVDREREFEASSRALDAERSRIAELSGVWQNAATDAAGYFSQTEEGSTSFDWEGYLTDAETTLAAANDYKERILTVPDDIKAEAERVFSQQGARSADEYLKSYEGASDANRGRFEAAARANGQAAGDAAARAFAERIPPTVNSKLTVDTSALDALRQRLLTPLGVKVNVEAPPAIRKLWQ